MNVRIIWHTIQAVIVAISSGLGWFLGGWDGLTIALVFCSFADYITGVFCAITEKCLSSEVGFKGIIKKTTIIMIVGVSHLIDNAIGTNGLLRNATIIFFISNEGISLLENACRLGLPVPDKLKDILSQLHKKGK